MFTYVRVVWRHDWRSSWGSVVRSACRIFHSFFLIHFYCFRYRCICSGIIKVIELDQHLTIFVFFTYFRCLDLSGKKFRSSANSHSNSSPTDCLASGTPPSLPDFFLSTFIWYRWLSLRAIQAVLHWDPTNTKTVNRIIYPYMTVKTIMYIKR